MPLVKKDDRMTIEITGLGSSGEGVGKVEGFTFFVPGALPGEKVEAQVTLAKKTYATAKLVKLLEVSPDRVQPPCPIFDCCGGCQLQHLDYPAQLAWKREKVRAAFERIGHFTHPPVEQTLGMADPWQYRNKMLFAVGGQKGKTALGCYARASHEVVDAQTCLIQDERNNLILSTVRSWMDKYKLAPYNEQTGQGLVRNVLGRVGGQSGQVMAGLVTRDKTVPFLAQLVKDLCEKVPGLVSVVQIVKKDKNNIVLSGEQYILFGKPHIKDCINGLSFNISAKSFFQVNSEQTQVLYRKALDMAALSGQEIVIEAYSGTGTIGMLFAQKVAKVYGLELSPAAIADARANAKGNSCQNIEFIQGDVAQTLPELLKKSIKADVFVVDPPRAGLSEKVIRTVIEALPEKIIYISCNPASQARDAALLKDYYKLVSVRPVDMFPMTAHVEAISKLVRK